MKGEMNIVTKSLSELHHPELNARMHPDKQITELKRSLQKDGQTRLLVIDENGTIWIGNGLYQAMSELGYTEAYCLLKEGMSEVDKKKMMWADNRIFDLGVDDMSAFDAFIAELGDDLDVPGYDDDLLRSLVADDSEIDEMMSSYGVVDEERKEQILNAGEEYRRQESALPPTNAPAQSSTADGESSSQSERYVICPKCGERIWL